MYEIYKELLDQKGLKNADVSRATRISNMTLSDWKNGKSKPKHDKMILIAEFLNVSVEYLTTGKEKDLSGEADILISVRNDKRLMQALKVYMTFSDKQKNLVLNTIENLGDLNND